MHVFMHATNLKCVILLLGCMHACASYSQGLYKEVFLGCQCSACTVKSLDSSMEAGMHALALVQHITDTDNK